MWPFLHGRLAPQLVGHADQVDGGASQRTRQPLFLCSGLVINACIVYTYIIYVCKNIYTCIHTYLCVCVSLSAFRSNLIHT